jgi:predicted ester cyclase
VVDHKRVVERLVADVMNAANPEALAELCTPRMAARLRRWFGDFRAAFPDWRQEIVELVAEGDVVAARFRCTGTQLGPWMGEPASGRHMSVDEVYFFRFSAGRIDAAWGLEDTWSRLLQLGTAKAALRRANGDADGTAADV